ncbi:uncharacterized protein LOC111887260 [Lactuca sativa]|uniref:uncharacterized protein LOC111887260 n=1 Tax=Lactuca sativa TaxID=4236 RepID=UPI000CD99355|nr:uncharacterized protein LOC111887260 [Lactuca sativa]
MGKQSRKSHPTRVNTKIIEPLELLHIDLFGTSAIESIGSSKYILVIIDDISHFTWVFFLKQKSEATPKLKAFIKQVEFQLCKVVRNIRSDNALEFKNQEFEEFLVDKGASHNFSAPYTPQQNGMVERINKGNLSSIRSSLVLISNLFEECILLFDKPKSAINSESKAADNKIDNLKNVIDEAAKEMESEHQEPTRQPGPSEPPKESFIFHEEGNPSLTKTHDASFKGGGDFNPDVKIVSSFERENHNMNDDSDFQSELEDEINVELDPAYDPNYPPLTKWTRHHPKLK